MKFSQHSYHFLPECGIHHWSRSHSFASVPQGAVPPQTPDDGTHESSVFPPAPYGPKYTHDPATCIAPGASNLPVL